MNDSGTEKPARAPTRSLADLVVPRRPAGIAYELGEDHDAQALLTLNGYPAETKVLIDLLESDIGILRAAAARTLGAKDEHSAIPALTKIANDTSAEETVCVQAAYALARMNVDGAKDILARFLDLSPESSPAPLQAAGTLARLGDSRGFPLVRRALDSPNPLTAMVACKQLFAFVALDGHPLPDGGRVDVAETFRRALARHETNISEEARTQLQTLDPEIRAKLNEELGR